MSKSKFQMNAKRPIIKFTRIARAISVILLDIKLVTGIIDTVPWKKGWRASMKRTVRLLAIFVLLITGALFLFVAACGSDNQQASNNVSDPTYERDQAQADIVKAYADSGYFEKALDAADTISDNTMRDEALESIGRAYIRISDLGSALAITDRMIINSYLRNNLLVSIVYKYAGAGNIEGAVAVASRISDDKDRGLALSEIAQVYINIGNLESALVVASEISYDDARGWTLERIVYAFANAGDFDKALAIADEIPTDGVGEYWHNLALSDIMLAHTSIGDFKNILVIAEKLQVEARVWALANVVDAYIRVGDFEKALAIAEEIPTDGEGEYWRSRAFAIIARAYAESGDFESAIAIAGEILDDHQRNMALQHIREAIAQASHESNP